MIYWLVNADLVDKKDVWFTVSTREIYRPHYNEGSAKTPAEAVCDAVRDKYADVLVIHGAYPNAIQPDVVDIDLTLENDWQDED